MDDIKIKACSPDNGVQLAQLVALFQESYGDQFPFPGVYDAEYWSRNIGPRFSSVVAVRRNKVVAHLAARPESKGSRVIQLCFPACAAELRDQAIEVAEEAWKLFESVAARQQWSTAYYAAFSDIELMQRIGVEALRMSSTAILPAYIPLQNPRCARADHRTSREGARSHVVVGQRLLAHSTPNTAPLFVPKRHLEMSRYLFSCLGMSGAAARLENYSKSEQPLIQADAAALQPRVFKDWGAAHFVVRPSLLSGYQESLFEVSRVDGAQSFLFIDARDSACPEYCEFLEGNGYIYSGILPNLFDTDNLVYSRATDSTLDVESFVCPVAKKLACYMNEQDARRTSAAHSLPVGGSAKYVAARS